MAVGADGKIYPSGPFRTINGVYRPGFVRLNSDGSVDQTYYGRQGGVPVVQPDGKILLIQHTALRRLHQDGSLDSGFVVKEIDGKDHLGLIQAILPLPNGEALLGGIFYSYAFSPWSHLIRINNQGSIDPTFTPNLDESVAAMALQPDGRILIAGYFNRVGVYQRSKLARIHPDGSYDKSFDPGIMWEGPQEAIHCLAVRENGQILLGGSFRTFNGLESRGPGGLASGWKIGSECQSGPWTWVGEMGRGKVHSVVGESESFN